MSVMTTIQIQHPEVLSKKTSTVWEKQAATAKEVSCYGYGGAVPSGQTESSLMWFTLSLLSSHKITNVQEISAMF